MIEKKDELVRFSKWIRAQLLEKSMTARELSIVSGVDESEVSKLTRGVRWPSLLTLKKIAPHLKWTPDEFFTAAGFDGDSGSK